MKAGNVPPLILILTRVSILSFLIDMRWMILIFLAAENILTINVASMWGFDHVPHWRWKLRTESGCLIFVYQASARLGARASNSTVKAAVSAKLIGVNP